MDRVKGRGATNLRLATGDEVGNDWKRANSNGSGFHEILWLRMVPAELSRCGAT